MGNPPLVETIHMSDEKIDAAKAVLLEERGLFWWADETMSPNQFAPDSSIGGELRITAEGRITLDLDGFLTTGSSPFSALDKSDDPLLRTRKIQGLLRGTSKRVLLSDLSRRGGRSASANVSYEGFMALHCLVGDRDFPKSKGNASFLYVDVDLNGFEEWFRSASIHVKRGRVALHANYRHPKQIDYPLPDGKLSIIYDLSGPFFGTSRNYRVSLNEAITLRFRREKKVLIEEAQADYRILQDLLTLLTDSTYNLDWPTVAVTNQHQYTLYFQRFINTASAPRYHECLTNFLQIKESFGEILGTWRAKRESFGPGFYLYLGTRRGMQLYSEHRFIMLIWGIEAFHRRKYGSRRSGRTAERITRVLEQLPDKKDKKWLADRLKYATEPNLQQRIFETLKAIPLGLDHKRLRRFAEGCARNRNDISHFGEHRDGSTPYSEFILELSRKSDALAYLYHVLILHEIGLSETILRWWVNESFYSFRIKFALASVGLR
jgi:hypothetical protein